MEVVRVVSASSTNSTFVTLGPLVVRGYYATNKNFTEPRFIHLFDRTGVASPTSMDGIQWTITLPTESGANVSWENGLIFPDGIAFSFSTQPDASVAVASQEIVFNLIYAFV